MFTNLPEQITIENIQQFNFGNIEANDDRLLFDSVCKTSSILEFINGTKNIVLGEKGTGKTALYRLIKEGKLEFTPKDNNKNIIIPVEDNFHYKNIKSKLLKLISTDIDDEIYKYQIIWELFLYQKIINKIKSTGYDLPINLLNSFNLCKKLFNSDPNESLISFKKTFGIRFQEITTTVCPEVFFSTEPVENNNSKIQQDSREKLEIKIDEFKENVNSFLKKHNLNLIIIIDRLDEFVSQTARKTQLNMLEALISLERENNRYSNIELKIFLRDDLFKQLEFDGIGYDKVITKKVDLIWDNEAIRQFIALRIFSNYKKVFNIQKLMYDEATYQLEVITSDDIDNYKKPQFYKRIYRQLIKKINSQHYEQRFPRRVSFSDDICKNIILTMFPKYVEHFNSEGKMEDIDIFLFFSTHFNLGTGNSIPRLILIFLEKWLSTVSNYYFLNPDQSVIKQNDKNCFEIVKHGFFEKAYSDFKEDIFISFAKLNPEFEKQILLLRERIGKRYSFKAKELKGLLSIKEDNELYHFCNYLLHIGYLKRTNNTTTIEDMKFEIPILFRKTS